MEQYVDVSRLDPPEPMEVILDKLGELGEGDYLKVHHSRNPVPLFRILRDLSYESVMRSPSPGHFEILIWAKGQPPPPGVVSHSVGADG